MQKAGVVILITKHRLGQETSQEIKRIHYGITKTFKNVSVPMTVFQVILAKT